MIRQLHKKHRTVLVREPDGSCHLAFLCGDPEWVTRVAVEIADASQNLSCDFVCRLSREIVQGEDRIVRVPVHKDDGDALFVADACELKGAPDARRVLGCLAQMGEAVVLKGCAMDMCRMLRLDNVVAVRRAGGPGAIFVPFVSNMGVPQASLTTVVDDSPCNIPPEAFESSAIDDPEKALVYSIGSFVHQLATGTPRFVDIWEQMRYVSWRTQPALVDASETSDPELFALLYRCMSFEPEERPGMAELLL